jgi:hypothetical protein
MSHSVTPAFLFFVDVSDNRAHNVQTGSGQSSTRPSTSRGAKGAVWTTGNQMKGRAILHPSIKMGNKSIGLTGLLGLGTHSTPDLTTTRETFPESRPTDGGTVIS